MRILAAGGAGYIGCKLIPVLLERGYEVDVVDLLWFGNHLPENVNVLQKDLFKCQPDDLKDYDQVIFLAGLSNDPMAEFDPSMNFIFNGALPSYVAFIAKKAGVKRFIYAGSSSTYGDNPDLPKVEEKIGSPLSPYAITKYSDELFAENFSNIYGIEVIGLRYFNVFGRRQDPEGAYAAVIPKFIGMLLKHESPVINGDGTISRDFTYIDNVIQVNHLAALAHDKASVNQVYNVAYGERTTLNELFGYLQKIIGSFDGEALKIKPVYGPARAGDIPHSQASVEKAKRLLGYSPGYSVADGLPETVEWFRKNL